MNSVRAKPVPPKNVPLTTDASVAQTKIARTVSFAERMAVLSVLKTSIAQAQESPLVSPIAAKPVAPVKLASASL